MPAVAAGAVGQAQEVPPALPRKVIYNASVDLIVEDLSPIGSRVAALVRESGGYIAETDASGDANSQRRATWKVRVPVEKFDGFLETISKLGELQRTHLDSQDVTQEYYDLEARIHNKQQEEKRLLKHLEDSTGKLEDILAVERELSRVRGEVEQMQGRIRYLANVTALSTVTITVTEIKDYVPPVAPTFATRIQRTFDSSVSDLTEFGQMLVLNLVAVLPWLPLIGMAVLVAWFIGKRLIRRLTWGRPVQNG